MTTPPKRRFQHKLAAIAVVLAVTPVVVIALLLVDVNRAALRERSEEVLFAVTDDVAHSLSNALDEARTQLSALALVLGDASHAIDQRLAIARALVAASGARTVAIYDASGAHVDSIVSPGSRWSPPPALSPALRELASRDGFAMGEPVLVEHTTHVPLVVPIRGDATQWFAVAGVSLAPLSEHLFQLSRNHLAGRFDAVMVVDSGRRAIVHVDPERQLLPADDTILDDIDGEAIPTGVLVYRDRDTSKGGMVGVVRSVPGLPWAVVAQIPRAQVYAAVAHARKLVMIAVGVTAALALVAAILWTRRAARPIRQLVALAQDLGQRKFDRRVDLRTGDELETLAHAMASAARELDASERRLQEEAAIRTQLGRYLPGKLVERIVAADPSLSLGGERREVTVVFADIAAFTALAEREPPDRVVALLNQLFTVLTEIVFRHGGTVDKFLGDCLMAFWGAPDDQPDHAQRAVAAAIDMQRWLDVANDCWETSLGLTIHVAIGVHSGEAIVGNLGSETRMDYTCVGDTVNVASRLEALARPQQILITEATRAQLDPAVRCARIGTRQLPGRRAPVDLHEVIL
jgi:adenylate cyclase